MASKVNTKFVFMLTGALVALFVGVAGVYLFIKLRSGERSARLGEAAMARGDYDAADVFFSKAVYREQANVDWLRKWKAAKESKIPDTQTKYQEEFMGLRGVTRQLAIVQRTNLEAYTEHLGGLLRQYTEGMAGDDAWSNLADEADTAIEYFAPEEPLALRRFRGIALAARAQGDARLDPELVERAREDLQAALAADPKDHVAANELAGMHQREARRHAEAGRTADEAKAMAEASRVISAMASAAPDSFAAQLSKLLLEVTQADRGIDVTKAPGEQVMARRAAREALKPALARVHQLGLRATSEDLNLIGLSRFDTIAGVIDPAGARELSRSLLTHALSLRPDDDVLMSLRAQNLSQSGDTEGALAEYQKIAELPNLKLSFEGVRRWGVRQRARFQMANIAATRAVREQGEARASWLERATEYRRRLAQEVREDSAQLTIVDAKLALARGELRLAQGRFEAFLKNTDEVPDQELEATLLLADTSIQLNEPGRAKELLKKVDEGRPNLPEVLVALAGLEVRTDNLAEAARLYKRALDADPTNAEARQRLTAIEAAMGGNVEQVRDPVERALVEAQRAQRGTAQQPGDDRKAREIVERALAPNRFDPRLVGALVNSHMGAGDRAAARQVLERAIAARPDVKEFPELLNRLGASETLEGALALIDAAKLPPGDRLLQRYQAFTQFDKKAEAEATLDEAIKAVPDDPRFLELQFLRAMQANKLDEAQALSDRASRMNADAAEGDTFKARLEIAKGNLSQASSLLQRAIDRGNAPVAVHRIQGQVLMRQGRPTEAIRAFGRAVELNSNDVQSVIEYVAALASADQRPEALTQARRIEPMARGNAQFVDLWLNLEAQSGNVAFARQRREQILEAKPDDLENVAYLAELRMIQRDWDGAKALIERLKKDDPSLRTVSLGARWHFDRGDLKAAMDEFRSHIEALQKDNKLTSPDPFIAFGQFLIQRGQNALGVRAMEQGARFQDPKTREIDRMVGDTQLQLGMFESAEKTYKGMIEAGVPDPKMDVRKRYIEALVQQQRWADVQAEFARIGAAADTDAEMLQQQAAAARGMGDLRRVRELLDKAITQHPQIAMLYVRRARLSMIEPGGERDAQEDLDTALRLQPGLWQALIARSSLMTAMGQRREALESLRQAIEANPSRDAIRFLYMRELIRDKRDADAQTVAEEALRLRPTDLQLLGQFGQIFAEGQFWSRAARFYREVWLQSPEMGAPSYVSTLLKSTPPNLADANAMLRRPEVKVDGNPNMMLVRAAIRKAEKRDADARNDVRGSLATIKTVDSSSLENWYSRMREIFVTPEEAAAVLQDARAQGGVNDYLDMWRARILAEKPGTLDQGAQKLRELIRGTSDEGLRGSALVALSSAYGLAERWEDLAEVSREALRYSPGNMFFLNNLAFVLSSKLNKPEEGLAMAEQAHAKAPEEPAVLDTLATAQWAAGKREEAIQTLGRAIRRYRTESEKGDGLLRLGQWQAEVGRTNEARGTLTWLRELMVDDPGLKATLEKQADELASRLAAK